MEGKWEMGNYQSLNVLNQRSFLDDFKEHDAINEVTAMVNASGNRSTRRRIEKALNKTQNISKHANKKANERANRELANKAEEDMVWLYSMAGLTLYKKYHWNNDGEHGQIESFFDKMTSIMNQYNEKGYTVDDCAKEFEELTGIQLVAEKH